MESEITFQIKLVKPPPDIMFGLQKGSGSIYETVQKQVSKSSDLTFRFALKLKGDKSKEAQPIFSGSYVQGPKASRFVYIDIGTYAGQIHTTWSRRLKIPLTGIKWEDIESLNEGSIFETIVPGTGKDGGPNCATVKPFAGWRIKPH